MASIRCEALKYSLTTGSTGLYETVRVATIESIGTNNTTNAIPTSAAVIFGPVSGDTNVQITTGSASALITKGFNPVATPANSCLVPAFGGVKIRLMDGESISCLATSLG